MLQAREFDQLVPRLAPQPVSPGTQAALERLASGLPSGVTATQLIAFIHNASNDATDLAFAIGPDDAPRLARISVQRTQDAMAVRGLFVDPLPAPLSDVVTMSWRGKSLAHYLIVAVAVVVPLFILVTLVRCIRARLLRYRWLWALAILFGVGQVTLNWHTGEFAVRLLYLQLFGAGYMAPVVMSPIAWPLLISVSLPAGAVAFHVKSWRARQPANTAV
jgi:hypothetical protein